MGQGMRIEDLGALTAQLVAKGLITKDQLAVAEVTKQTLGGDIGNILIKKGFIQEDIIREFLTQSLHLDEMSLSDLPIEPHVIKTVPLSVAKKYHFMPLYQVDDLMAIAVSDPLSLFAIADMRDSLGCDIQPVLASQEQIDRAIALHYQSGAEGSMIDESVKIVQKSETSSREVRAALTELSGREKIVTIANTILNKAVRMEASDIHIEPMEDETKVRCRLDGLLQELAIYPRVFHVPLVSRLKVMGGMDIAERRIPQDGRVRLKVQGIMVDLRMSTYPTINGEKIVIRLLPKSNVLTLDMLGFSDNDQQRFTDLIYRPHGIFLVTGPTGSGKSSTLYAALQKVNSQERNIVSVEDPVENEIRGVNQAQVNIKAGMTFAAALRSILRQDPDIIMLGEVRDSETADMAVRAALTGHLVFSTLHTNTAAGAIERLTDMGVERFLLSSALLGLLGQRLVRRICEHCREEIAADDGAKQIIDDPQWKGPLYRGKGCKKCRMNGYRGRIGIFELITLDDTLRAMISSGAGEDQILQHVAKMEGWNNMRKDGIEKVKAGVTTLDEVMRVT